MRRYTIAEARSKFARIIDEAEAGQRIELTRRGVPVAVMVSCEELERLQGKRPRFKELYEEFLKDVCLEEVGVDEDFAESLRSREMGREITF